MAPDHGFDSMFKSEDMARRYRSAEVVTGAFARILIEKAGLLEPSPEPTTILDNACGTGVVAAALFELLDQSTRDRMELICGDFSDSMIKSINERIEANGWKKVTAKNVDAQRTRLPDEGFTHVITNFAIMALPNPKAALNECLRILKPGGMCAFSVWGRVGWVDDVREAFATLPGRPPFPDYVTLTKSWGSGDDWHEPAWVEETVKKHGFVDVSVEPIAKDLAIANAAEFADTISVMIPMILKRFWTEEEREKNEDKVMPGILKYMTEKYGEGKPILLHWVANLVTARKSSETRNSLLELESR